MGVSCPRPGLEGVRVNEEESPMAKKDAVHHRDEIQLLLRRWDTG